MEILKVSAKSNPNSVAGAIAGIVRKDGGLTWYADRRLWILKLKTKRKQRFGCYWRGSKGGKR